MVVVKATARSFIAYVTASQANRDHEGIRLEQRMRSTGRGIATAWIAHHYPPPTLMVSSAR